MLLAEFAANNYVSKSTSITPFYANEGRHPRFTVDNMLDDTKTGTIDVVGLKKLKRE